MWRAEEFLRTVVLSWVGVVMLSVLLIDVVELGWWLEMVHC